MRLAIEPPLLLLSTLPDALAASATECMHCNGHGVGETPPPASAAEPLFRGGAIRPVVPILPHVATSRYPNSPNRRARRVAAPLVTYTLQKTVSAHVFETR